jgi:hypothetical protein
MPAAAESDERVDGQPPFRLSERHDRDAKLGDETLDLARVRVAMKGPAG